VDLNTTGFLSKYFRDQVIAEAETVYDATCRIVRLRHMLEHALEAVQLADGKGRGDLEADRLLELGLTRLLKIIGEEEAPASRSDARSGMDSAS
jgi:hypothetical protein